MTYFTTKDEYLEFRAEWKTEYKEVSRKIRELKNSRKQFIWEYRAKGDTASKRRNKIGGNPNYNYSWNNISSLNSLRIKAREMNEELIEAKQEAARQYLKAKQGENAMA